MKPSMLVIDHIFHTKTKSFDFLFKIFEEEFDLTVHYIDPKEPFSLAEDMLKPEYVLICQLDFTTPFFIFRGKRVVVVQMYDGSAGLPDAHWVYNHQASYINFSVGMHFRALNNGCRSILAQFFPDPAKSRQLQDFSTRRVFFWERLPRSDINATRVAALIGEAIDSIHVHQSSDDRSRPSDLTDLFRSRVTTSAWFEDRLAYEATLDSCNIFVAPRSAEGIGHAFLEAMAKGMVVLANDMPTHNEYISNWQNGILFDATTERIDLGDWKQFAPTIGQRARSSIVNGHTNWITQAKKLVEFVRQTSRSSTPNKPFLSRFVRETMAEYQEGLENYSLKLNENPLPVQVFGYWQTMDLQTDDQSTICERFSDKGLNFVFGQALHDNLLGSGWSEPEVGHVWAVESASTVTIPGVRSVGHCLRLVIEVRALANKRLKVTFAGRLIGYAQIGVSLNYYAFDELVRFSAAGSATLGFEVEGLDGAQPDPRRFAFMLSSIRLVPKDFVIVNDRAMVVPSCG